MVYHKAGWRFQTCFIFPFRMSSSQLTHIFQRGRLKPPTRFTGLKQGDPPQIYHFYGWDWNDQSIWVVYGIALLALHLVVLRTIHWNIYKHSNNQSKINIPIVDILDMICIGIVSKLYFHSTIYPIDYHYNIPIHIYIGMDIYLYPTHTSLSWSCWRCFFSMGNPLLGESIGNMFFVVDNLLGNVYHIVSLYI